MKILKIKGIINVEGMKFYDIEGGFGDHKKAMLVKEIASIHGRDLKEINRNINSNKKRFIDGVDILDLKNTEFEVLLNHHEIYSQNALNRSSNIYILSERGYSKLLKILEDDFAWEQYEKLVDGYFNMRNSITNPYNLSKELQAIFMLDEKTQKQDERITKLENTMTIDYNQQEILNNLAKKTVLKALGGKDAPAYKELSKKAFAGIWRDFKRIMEVNSYRNTAVKEFEKAFELIKEWKPNRELALMIRGANAQLIIDVK